MSMRMMECNVCGEPLSAADDEELLRRLRAHFESEHASQAFDEEQERQAIAEQAYSASDN